MKREIYREMERDRERYKEIKRERERGREREKFRKDREGKGMCGGEREKCTQHTEDRESQGHPLQRSKFVY